MVPDLPEAIVNILDTLGLIDLAHPRLEGIVDCLPMD